MSERDNIINLPTAMNVLADRIRVAYGRTERGRREWIEGTLELAAALLEARGQFKADRQFAHWIVDAGLEDISHQDRAALISMADDLAATRRMLEETKRLSWRYIWEEEMKPWFTQAGKPTLPPQNPEKLPLIPDLAPEAPAETTAPAASIKPVSKRSPFHGWPRADEVAAVYLSIEARRELGKIIKVRGGKEIWPLILTAIDAGFLTATETGFTKATLRILFPCGDRAYCGRFDLANVKERQHVRDHIMPAALAKRDAILASPDQLESIVALHWQRHQEATREAVANQKVADALRAMPTDQRAVMMYGVRLWPRVEHQFGTYDYDQICAAIWYFRDFDGWVQGGISGKTPGSRAIIARLSTRWPQEYIDRAYTPETRGKIKKVYQLVHLLARLLEENPEGECVVPPTPKTEGQW